MNASKCFSASPEIPKIVFLYRYKIMLLVSNPVVIMPAWYIFKHSDIHKWKEKLVLLTEKKVAVTNSCFKTMCDNPTVEISFSHQKFDSMVSTNDCCKHPSRILVQYKITSARVPWVLTAVEQFYNLKVVVLWLNLLCGLKSLKNAERYFLQLGMPIYILVRIIGV